MSETKERWTGIKGDDETLVNGEYMLRAEQMDDSLFWWCVYFNDDRIADETNARTMRQAKLKARAAMNKHIKH